MSAPAPHSWRWCRQRATFADKLLGDRSNTYRRVEVHIKIRTYRDVPDVGAWDAWPDALVEVRRHLRELSLDDELDVLRAHVARWHRYMRAWLRRVLLPDPCSVDEMNAWRGQVARLDTALENEM